MADRTPLSEAEVKTLVDRWYQKLDVHAQTEDMLPMLADGDLEMRFPEATLRGQSDFRQWYEGVIRIFFDEIHEMKTLDIQTALDQAEVKLVVNWQAHRWYPPAAKSEWLGFDAVQRWIVKRSPTTNDPVIVTYIVDELIPMPGSTPL